ncbi:XkdX family protein (plasmid) [Apilactobacillus apisilvae]|uniref:XkdX family protein n=1 Tax=Apilactobacillus apisilvae TaxID=2923364 RepID=A0ABY4PK66_9LACO|nr:XkdX family protein [Apilactobacillus apisilvae]UQS85828.1 XkdX family protein [Apilactobacillus apisilvae]
MNNYPSKQDIKNEWNWGWFNDNYDQLRMFVKGQCINKDDFKEICGVDYDDQTNGQNNKETPAENGGGTGTPAN